MFSGIGGFDLAAMNRASSSSGRAKSTKSPELFTDDIFPTSQSTRTQQRLTQDGYPTSMSALLASLARRLATQGGAGDLRMPEAHSFLKSLGCAGPKNHNIFLSRTSLDYCITKEGRLSARSCASLMTWGMMSNGVCLTLRVGALSRENGLSLSAVLEPPERVPEKYYLSQKMLDKLVLRADCDYGTEYLATRSGKSNKLMRAGHVGSGKYQNEIIFDSAGKARTLTVPSTKKDGRLDGGYDGKTGLYLVRYLKEGKTGRCAAPPVPGRHALTVRDRHGNSFYAYVRRLMPIECERLQGFSDGWTGGQTDGHRYKQLGNAVCVPVVEHVLGLIENRHVNAP